ncbi:unnamed protein product [Polarella glacialis]|uniref:Sulfotransferase n=1 Tax=Polarella glacialis TaxID=89957 RepID=A0A813K5K2_POLGL|nr:unnamed protein product [Polarella glacialis]
MRARRFVVTAVVGAALPLPSAGCDRLLLLEESLLPTLLREEGFGLSVHTDAPGAAPAEARLEALSELWERCAAQGGRLWEVLAPEAEYGAALCAPATCGQLEVVQLLWPRVMFGSGGPTSASPGTQATELGHWKQLQLDFVLAGFEKCGTSSLSHNLARHPDVEFIPAPSTDRRINTDDQLAQDGNLFWHVGNRLLPPASLVASFNAGLCCSGGARVTGVSDAELVGPSLRSGSDESSSSRGGSQVKRGERNPVYAFHRVIMKMVSLVPGAKVVLLACDPIRWLHSAHADTTNWYAASQGDSPPPMLREFALNDLVPAPSATALSRGWYNLSRRRAFFTRFAEGVARILGGQHRVHMLHRDSVDERLSGSAGAREAYDRLASYLGLRPFPPDFSFERRNIRAKKAPPQITAGLDSAPAPPLPALCAPSEVQALRVLRKYYRTEYARLPQWLSRLGGFVPAGVSANRSCCDA